jgi:hypothetical protein
MSDRVRNALEAAVGVAIGTALYDVIKGGLSVETAYRATFMALFLSVVYLIIPIKKPSSRSG